MGVNMASGRYQGWTATVVIGVVLLLGAVAIRSTRPRADYLPRTRTLVQQKETSLKTYNREMPLEEVLSFYEAHTGNPVSPEAFQALTTAIVEDVIPGLWKKSQARQAKGRWILHHAMFSSIQENYPHQTLTNADVIVFPDAPHLRVIVSEPNGDFFRDSGWHWRWIGKYLDGSAHPWEKVPKELDAYAAEELSEFLSVFAVAVVDVAASHAATDHGTIEARDINEVFEQIGLTTMEPSGSRQFDAMFSTETKERLIASLPNPMFRDVTDAMGIKYRHLPNPEHWIRRTQLYTPTGLAGGGVSACDYDGDGFTDLYFAGDLGGALFRNMEGRAFKNVSKTAGITRAGESRAGYFVDFDNDGDEDLFFTYVGLSNRLYENAGDGTFRDVTESVSLQSGNQITHEAVWCDVDNDGYLDVYTGNFGDWLAGDSPTIGRTNSNAPPNQLYLNRVRNGKHTFQEVAEDMHVADRGWTHCVGAFDFDGDGWMDLFSLNDFGSSQIFRNLKGRDFEEVSGDQKMDDLYNAMSFTLMDLHHSGTPSIYISQVMKLTHRQRYSRPTEKTAIVFDPDKKDNLRVLNKNRLFSQNEQEFFVDEHNQRIEPAYLGWAWDVSALDYENDTDMDLIVLNGTETNIPPNNLRIEQEMQESENSNKELSIQEGRNWLAAYGNEQNVCFLQQDGYFYDVSSVNPIAFKGNSRGSAFLDFDNDGDLDVAISNYDNRVQLFENLQNQGHAWVRFQLQGRRSNRNGVGAIVEINFDNKTRFDRVVSGSGFLSQNPYPLHFGLGHAKVIDKVLIHWPSGTKQTLVGLKVNRLHNIQEPLQARE